MRDLAYQVREGVAEIALGRAPANALTVEMVGQLIEALERARSDESVGVVILHSSVARRFCAGLDLTALGGATTERIRELVGSLYTGLHEAQTRLGKPSIAAIDGAARGGGMTVAISCDLLVAGLSASFGYPEIDLGLLPAIHFTHLPRIVGRHRAFDLLFSGRSFGAEEAAQLGLISRLVEAGQALAAARDLAQVLLQKPAGALRIGRQAFHDANDSDYRRGIAHAVDLFCHVATRAEGRAGVDGFLASRRPGEPG